MHSTGSVMTVRVSAVHRDHVLVDVIAVRVVKVAIVEIIDVIIVAHGDMTAPSSVNMGVLALMDGMRHVEEPTCRWSRPPST